MTIKTKKKTAKAKTKKIVVISLGDVRDVGWEDSAMLGIDLLKKMREAGFTPETEAPYVLDGGDVPLIIIETLEGSPYEVKKSVELLKSIVAEKEKYPGQLLNVFTQKEWDQQKDGWA